MNLTTLENRIATLEKEAKSYTKEERNNKVEALIEEFYAANGRHMSSYHLQRLADVILVEELKDKTPDKVSKKEYPVLSNRQSQTRTRREFSVVGDTLDFIFAKEHKRLDSTFKKRTQNMDDQS
ncbi:hypothetical protein FT641_27025 [Bacillus paranthracis]|uniref:hypothetical protein n=1 Tax=Bacillus paranthracis TaxID=2026186 RepID=UPI00187ABE60|nr:hypothetical protein [Bacillus paranthracis]MBE7117306.1 hypothetical protein [Bacillus paranthracis]MBE7134920.1 hypothetical protein [Bacillus paranthracis]MBE7156329.1 hypothetical protein [Bacillus paranthracis]